MAFSGKTTAPDADFNELRNKDETTDVTGFVDEVHAPAVVGSKTKYDLFKFVLNNDGTKRIVCLVWGKTIIQPLVDSVTVRAIVHIKGAVTKSVAQNFFKESNNLVPFELLIKEVTTVEFIGQHVIQEYRPVNLDQIQDVEFSDIGKVTGLIRVRGNSKMKFVRSLDRFKHEYYGCGCITDGISKVTVHIANYVGLNIEKGVLINVVGETDETARPVTIKCRNDSSVAPIDDGAVMDAATLARGVNSPKRGLE